MQPMNGLLPGMLVAAAALALAGPARGAGRPGPALKVDATLTQDYFRDVQGGRHRGGAGPGNLFAGITADGRAWGGSPDDRVRLRVLQTFGGSISNQAGDLQGLDNVEAYNTLKVYSAWYQHRFGRSGVSTRLGLQDYNALFNTLDAASLFLNSSFGIPATTAQSHVSQYPTTAVGAVLRWHSAGGAYALAGVYDGRPGDPDHPGGTHIHFEPGHGLFYAGETGFRGGRGGRWKAALGGWYQTSDYAGATGRSRDRDHSVYLIAQAPLDSGGGATWNGFIQLGSARRTTNVTGRYLGIGVNAAGLLPGRPKAVLGLGLARAYTTRAWRRATPDAAQAETVMEVTWRFVPGDHLTLQPDVQYIIDPGATHRLDNAWLAGLRARIDW